MLNTALGYNFLKILNDNVWGGQIEIISLSKVLQCKICVIQSEMPNELQFGESEDKKLIIVYYRHLCTLGEHYNSTVYGKYCLFILDVNVLNGNGMTNEWSNRK